ncbi:uncharacterized protein LOC17875914 [Capsella rubella]|uniref:uncharacterized protein LOC17875914 n=1 Tax=Capsella rubella TaxID=81985 RepID=UPI000CD59247|nr:uncharacterized protein LOC17875914 [Capsella rubella]
MILADLEGTLIHATVKKQQVNKFHRMIVSGEWRTFENFQLTKSMGKNRATKHAFKMTFTNTTVIGRSPILSDDMFLDLADFGSILDDNGLNEKILIDVLGQVVRVGAMKTHDQNGKISKQLEIELRDTSDNRFSCTLWGRFAENMWDECEKSEGIPVNCLIRLAKINMFNGQRSISLPNDTLSLSFIQQKPVQPKGEKKVDFYNRVGRKTVSELLEATENMRLCSGNLSLEEAKEIQEFSEWILAVGDGKISEPNDEEVLIDIPEELLITDADDPIEAISKLVYGDPQIFQKESDPEFFQQRAFLCPTNEDVGIINDYMLDQLQGEEEVHLSSDSIDPLKVGCPVMLLRNINARGGLTQLAEFVIEAIIITGDRVGDKVLIPRILLSPSDTKLMFLMRRRQLPLVVAFAMTINKSQGQSLSNVGRCLPRPCFSHGQLYVALSRVTSKKGLKVLIVDNDNKPKKKTTNVVFKEVFKKL